MTIRFIRGKNRSRKVKEGCEKGEKSLGTNPQGANWCLLAMERVILGEISGIEAPGLEIGFKGEWTIVG